MKKTSKLYRIIPLVIIFTIFISSIPSVAITNNTGNLKRVQLSSGKTVTLTQQQLDDIIEVSLETDMSIFMVSTLSCVTDSPDLEAILQEVIYHIFI